MARALGESAESVALFQVIVVINGPFFMRRGESVLLCESLAAVRNMKQAAQLRRLLRFQSWGAGSYCCVLWNWVSGLHEVVRDGSEKLGLWPT